MPRNIILICIILFSIIYFIQAENVYSQANYNIPYNYYQAGRGYYPQGIDNQNHENVLIILDSSYSMNDRINGERKIDIAKRVITSVLNQLPKNISVGLRIYGHKSDPLGFRACTASELKVAIGPYNKGLVADALNKARPVGMTPITYSLSQAIANDFRGINGKKRIILVSDGMETCNGSPCEYAVNLVKNRVDIKIDVIGFDLDEPSAVSQLKCVALSTKGKFYTANNAQELSKSLSQSLNIIKEVQGTILNKK